MCVYSVWRVLLTVAAPVLPPHCAAHAFILSLVPVVLVLLDPPLTPQSPRSTRRFSRRHLHVVRAEQFGALPWAILVPACAPCSLSALAARQRYSLTVEHGSAPLILLARRAARRRCGLSLQAQAAQRRSQLRRRVLVPRGVDLAGSGGGPRLHGPDLGRLHGTEVVHGTSGWVGGHAGFRGGGRGACKWLK